MTTIAQFYCIEKRDNNNKYFFSDVKKIGAMSNEHHRYYDQSPL